MKELSFVFLGKSELQHQGNLMLIALSGISGMGGVKEQYVPADIFSTKKTVVFDPTETRESANCYQKAEKIQVVTFIVKLFKHFQFVNFFQLRQKTENFREKWSPLIDQKS